MIVTGQRQHPAMAVGTGGIRLLQRIPGPVDARRLAVPDPENPVIV